ncbi:MAG: isocitrate/isopropylmalate dehydrogenase family protein [bacterium]|nr:isocitrate/isopropylmalate dehydrogenase family protein [bacterium]
MYNAVLIKGDGTGPEVVESAVRVIEATGVKIKWHEEEAGEVALKKYGTPLPESCLEAIKNYKVALKGPITTPVGSGFRSVNVALRKELELYAGVRPVAYLPLKDAKYENVDLVVVRENTEGMYSGVEHFVDKERTAAESIRIITRKATKRIVEFAFKYAQNKNRRKVTVVHKANILKATCGLFLEIAKEVATSFPEIEFEDRIIDNMAMQLVKKPQEYDIIVTSNLFGDILSDLCAGLVGGLGVASGANIGDDCAVFEPVHGSAPKYAGQNKVNPTATILSGAMLLDHLGENEASKKIIEAVKKVIKEGVQVTYDLGGQATTSQMTEALIRIIENENI